MSKIDGITVLKMVGGHLKTAYKRDIDSILDSCSEEIYQEIRNELDDFPTSWGKASKIIHSKLDFKPSIVAYEKKYRHFPIGLKMFEHKIIVDKFRSAIRNNQRRRIIQKALLSETPAENKKMKEAYRQYIQNVKKNSSFDGFLKQAAINYFYGVTAIYVLVSLALKFEVELPQAYEHFRQSLFLDRYCKQSPIHPPSVQPRHKATDRPLPMLIQNGLTSIQRDVMSAVEQLSHKHESAFKDPSFTLAQLLAHMGISKDGCYDRYQQVIDTFFELGEMDDLMVEDPKTGHILRLIAEGGYHGARPDSFPEAESSLFHIPPTTFLRMKEEKYFWVSAKVWSYKSLARLLIYEIGSRYTRTRNFNNDCQKKRLTIVLKTLFENSALPQLTVKNATRTIQAVMNAFCFMMQNGIISDLSIDQEDGIHRKASWGRDKHGEETVSLPVTGLKNPARNSGAIRIKFTVTSEHVSSLNGGLQLAASRNNGIHSLSQ